MTLIYKIVFVLSAMLSLHTLIASETHIGRYMIASHEVLESHYDLLAQTRQLHFPGEVTSLGDGIRYLLKHTGYVLVEEGMWKNDMKILLNQPLPLVHRKFGPISLRDGLQLLAGQAFKLVEDPLLRTIYFEILPAYQAPLLPELDTNTVDEELIYEGH